MGGSQHRIDDTSVSELEVIGEKIYAGVGERLLHSIDGGASWHPVQIPSIPISYHFAALSESGGKLYIAATRFAPGNVVGGIFQLDEESNALIELNTDKELYGIEMHGSRRDDLLCWGLKAEAVFRWEQGSDSWTNLGLEGHVTTALSVNGKRVYAGTRHGEIFRLEKAGNRGNLSIQRVW